ncbi:MAG: DUF3006 domain-containing protein [Thermoanaerobacteraceae bacterium]|nr:DUF3006 domain-containing protein [Thermoanaerobacteraceae bacterium]
MEKLCIVDRFEGSYAVLEYNGEMFNFPVELLPANVKEGDILDFKITVDVEETLQMKKRINEKMERLFIDED